MTVTGKVLLRVAVLGLAVAWGANRALGDAITEKLPDPPITEADGWLEFSFGSVGSFDLAGAFTFTGPETVSVTDGFTPGDQFAVFDNGVLLGDTSAVSSTSGDFCIDPAVCFADPNFSHGSFEVGGGSNSITIEAIASPFGGGGAWLEITPATAAVPEPASLVLLGTGLVALLGFGKRKLLR